MKGLHARTAAGEGASETEPDRDLAGALHEVSNALTVIMGWLDAAQSRAASSAAREAIEIAREHAELGYRVARRAIGAEVARDDERSALCVARDSVMAVRPEALRRGIKISLEPRGQCDVLLHNPLVAQQIVLNLLLNAIAFTPQGGKVQLALRVDHDGPVFLVRDEGPGIPAERADTLFSGPDSTRRGGAGIGLRYSCSLARSNGGCLSLIHAGPGACFELRWPSGEIKSGTHHSDVAVASLGDLRVLVVEDDQAVISLIELALEARGATVCSARNVSELQAVLEDTNGFDAALIDLSPIAHDVRGVLAKVKQTSRSAPLILISGVASGVPDEVDSQFNDWVRKPFTMDEVVTALQRSLRPSSGCKAEAE